MQRESKKWYDGQYAKGPHYIYLLLNYTSWHLPGNRCPSGTFVHCCCLSLWNFCSDIRIGYTRSDQTMCIGTFVRLPSKPWTFCRSLPVGQFAWQQSHVRRLSCIGTTCNPLFPDFLYHCGTFVLRVRPFATCFTVLARGGSSCARLTACCTTAVYNICGAASPPTHAHSTCAVTFRLIEFVFFDKILRPCLLVVNAIYRTYQ